MAFEAMSDLLGNGYEIFADGHEQVVLTNPYHSEETDMTNAYLEHEPGQGDKPGRASNPPFLDIARNDEVRTGIQRPPNDEVRTGIQRPPKTFDDYVFQFYIGSLTVVGLYAFFRIMQRSR